MGSFADRVRPWECANCGKRNISANRSECPRCHEPRPGTALAAVQESANQATRTYEGEKALARGIADMARQGWRVQSQSSYQPRAGVGRVVALGFVGALLVKPKARWVVVYTR